MPESFQPLRLSRVAHLLILNVAENPSRENLTALARHVEYIETIARLHGAQGISWTALVRF